MKKILCLILSLLMLVSLCACGNEPGKTDPAPAGTTAPPATRAPENNATQAPGGDVTQASGNDSRIEALFEGPALICSAGQSADFQMVQVMFQQNGMENKCKDIAKPEDFEGVKTIVVAIGGSSKGLGAAGIDADEELERVKVLLQAAIDKGIPIVSCHIGGSGRRGKLGDRYIEPVISMSNYCVFVSGGNADGYLTDCANKHNVPYTMVDVMTDCMGVFKALFK